MNNIPFVIEEDLSQLNGKSQQDVIKYFVNKEFPEGNMYSLLYSDTYDGCIVRWINVTQANLYLSYAHLVPCFEFWFTAERAHIEAIQDWCKSRGEDITPIYYSLAPQIVPAIEMYGIDAMRGTWLRRGNHWISSTQQGDVLNQCLEADPALRQAFDAAYAASRANGGKEVER
jgi:hypothetical protein